MVDMIVNNFDIWVDAQGIKSRTRVKSVDNISLEGITSLRELILELAIRGKLVSQNPTNEPASELIKKIRKDKEKLIKGGKIKKQDLLPENIEEGKPFELPIGWGIYKFGDLLFEAYTGLDRGKSYQSLNLKYRYFKMNNILNNGGFDLTDITFVDATESEVKKYCLINGDFLFNTRNSRELVGKTAVIRGLSEEVILYNNNILRAKFIHILPEVIDFWFRSISGRVLLEKIKSNTTNICAIYQGKLFELFCIIPPFAEQIRIVAKVDELMSLCDKLEVEQFNNLKTHQVLVKTLLETLTQAADANELQVAWERMSAHFDKLFCTEDSIDQLKQTILQLAVMGKLVKQDLNDEPASELVKKIAKEKDRLIEEGKIKKQAPLIKISKEEKPFVLPNSWQWVRLGDVTNYGFCEKVEPGSVDDSTWVLELEDIEKESSKLLNKIRVLDKKFQSSKNRFYKGDVIYGKLRPYLNKVLIADEDGVCTTEMIPVAGYFDISSEYLRLVLKSSYFINYATSSTHGMNLPRLGTDKARLALFPLTSSIEQKKIVLKVYELFLLCDELNEKIQKSQDLKVLLSKIIVEKAVQ